MSAVPAPLVLLGPTGSGKSDVAMAYCSLFAGCEIVAVDSMQVYRGMNIGTAKPTVSDREEVPHHCLDLVDPSEEFTVAAFAAAAASATGAIGARGARAVLVAGTGLYLRAITDPMEMPGQWPDLRNALEERAAAEGPEVLYAELLAADPTAAARIEPANARRIVRALEVVLGSGRVFSSYGPGLDHYPAIDMVQVGLRWNRDVLARRIEERVHRMVAGGLFAEVAAFWDGGRGTLSRTARQALGYKEVIEHLEGQCSADAAVDAIVLRTRQFAVRQERWFRRDPRVRWVDIEHDPVAEVLPVIEGL
mgnify:FL=1